jgi:hypothetical protein
MRRSASWTVIATFVVIMFELIGALVLSTVAGAGPGRDAAAYSTVLFVLATSAVGTLIGLRRPGNTIGWLLRLAGFGFATGSLLVVYIEVAVSQPESLPLGPMVVWLGDLMFQMSLGVCAVFLLLLFPTGQLPSPRWKVVGWLGAICIALLFGAVIFGPGAFEGLPIENPLALPESSPLLVVMESGWYLMLVTILASVASLIIRYRRAAGEERQQLKWVALGVIVLAFGFAVTFAWPGMGEDTENFVVALALAAMPISIGIAILRYRLYDIDRIISRTLSYGIVTALLAGAFVGLVVVLGGVLPTRGSSLAVAASTLAVAALFNPLRYRVQGRVDRRFNRSRYDLERTIEAFSERLRSEADLDRIGRDLQDVAAESMHPRSISLWLRA